MIRLEQVCKTFGTAAGDVHAVRDVSLDIREGEIFGIIGFSGAGKSTLVRCINLLERPTSGKVFVDGVELTGLSDKELRKVRKKIGMIFQPTSALDPQTTQSILKLLKQVNETLGITIVLITHEMAVVKDICDRVAIMENGAVVESGSTVDVFSHPAEEITRDFIETASNIRKIHDLIAEGNELTRVHPGEKMLLLTYYGDNAGEPLISYLSKAYNVRGNIIFGNIDYLKGKPLGKLVVTFSGEPENMKQAMDYMDSIGLSVEVIKE